MLEEQQKTWYYKISYFFIANAVVFKRLAIILLILINVGVWTWGVIEFESYLRSAFSYNKLMEDLIQTKIDWQNIQQKNKPQKITFSAVNILRNDDSYDFVVKAYNPNKDWKVRQVNYTFLVDNYMLEERSEFILPGQNKYLTSFSYSSKIPPQQVEFKVNNLQWQRIKNEELDKMQIIDNIIIDNKNFKSSSNLSQLSFEAFNNTHYNFWQIGWQIALYKNEKLYAYNYLTSNTFLATDKRQISATWLEDLSSPGRIEILPDVDVFDEGNYIVNTDKSTINLIKGARTKR